ncbi:hypothetical protein [Streptococcus suis]|uniref:hypothetical protein n=1 Tax=Streptococcus suis TaxID=1307 RepID=UPI00077AA2F0|nr:hypothetical protein [Streptococcus suis]
MTLAPSELLAFETALVATPVASVTVANWIFVATGVVAVGADGFKSLIDSPLNTKTWELVRATVGAVVST